MQPTHTVSLDGKTFAIGVLAVTACILFVGFMFVATHPAQAIGTSDRGGDYKMITQQLSTSQEGLVVVDAAAKQAIIYAFDYNTRILEIAAPIDLSQLPKPPREAVPPPRPPKRQ